MTWNGLAGSIVDEFQLRLGDDFPDRRMRDVAEGRFEMTDRVLAALRREIACSIRRTAAIALSCAGEFVVSVSISR